MNLDRALILGVPVDNLNGEDALESIFAMIQAYKKDSRPRYVATANTDFIVNTLSWLYGKKFQPNPLLRILRKADMVTPDGMPLVWASRFMEGNIRERITGADMVPAIVARAAQDGKKLFFLGGDPTAAERSMEILKERHPDLIIAGQESPMIPFDGDVISDLEANQKLVEKINRSGADVLFVALGNPKQEYWFEFNKDKLQVPVTMGIGGTLDFISGRTSRAPEWMGKVGMEWLFRLLMDPGRLWKRYAVDFFKFGFCLVQPLLTHLGQFVDGRKIAGGPGVKNLEIVLNKNIKTVVIQSPTFFNPGTVLPAQKILDHALESGKHVIIDLNQTLEGNAYLAGFLLNLKTETERRNLSLHILTQDLRIIQKLRTHRVYDALSGSLQKDIYSIFAALEGNASHN